jgi:hypothetical protein
MSFWLAVAGRLLLLQRNSPMKRSCLYTVVVEAEIKPAILGGIRTQILYPSI